MFNIERFLFCASKIFHFFFPIILQIFSFLEELLGVEVDFKETDFVDESDFAVSFNLKLFEDRDYGFRVAWKFVEEQVKDHPEDDQHAVLYPADVEVQQRLIDQRKKNIKIDSRHEKVVKKKNPEKNEVFDRKRSKCLDLHEEGKHAFDFLAALVFLADVGVSFDPDELLVLEKLFLLVAFFLFLVGLDLPFLLYGKEMPLESPEKEEMHTEQDEVQNGRELIGPVNDALKAAPSMTLSLQTAITVNITSVFFCDVLGVVAGVLVRVEAVDVDVVQFCAVDFVASTDAAGGCLGKSKPENQMENSQDNYCPHLLSPFLEIAHFFHNEF